MPRAFADEFEDAAGYGWTAAALDFDWPTLIANKDREIARLEAAYTADLEQAGVDHRQEPRGSSTDAHTVAAGRPARRYAPTTS